MKAIVLNTGIMFQGYLYKKALEKYFDKVMFTGPVYWSNYEYSVPKEEILASHTDLRLLSEVESYDIIIGTDHGALPTLTKMKEQFPDKIFAVQVLDFPQHVFVKNKDYNESALIRWQFEFLPMLSNMDYIFHNKHLGMETLKNIKTLEHQEHHFIRYPVNPIFFEEDEYERTNTIVFSGRLAPDKGLYNIIIALGFLKQKVKLVAIGPEFDFDYTTLAKHLRVDYEYRGQCSEKEKWKAYHESRFVVSGADNQYITALCILEGLSVGRAGVTFHSEENKLHYGEGVFYADLGNNVDLANKIDFAMSNPKLCEAFGESGKVLYEKHCSYDRWAEKVFQILSGGKDGKA